MVSGHHSDGYGAAEGGLGVVLDNSPPSAHKPTKMTLVFAELAFNPKPKNKKPEDTTRRLGLLPRIRVLSLRASCKRQWRELRITGPRFLSVAQPTPPVLVFEPAAL